MVVVLNVVVVITVVIVVAAVVLIIIIGPRNLTLNCAVVTRIEHVMLVTRNGT